MHQARHKFVSKVTLLATLVFLCAYVHQATVAETVLVKEEKSASANASTPGKKSAQDLARAAIRDAFNVWKIAAAKKDGKAAAEVMSHAGTEYYGKLRDMALYASEHDVKNLALYDQAQVLLLRLLVEPKVLRNMTNKEVAAYAVSSGFIGVGLMMMDTLEDVELLPDSATGRPYRENGKAKRFLVGFVKENNQWRIDHQYEIDRELDDLKWGAKAEKKDLDQYAFEFVEALAEKKVTDKTFEPLMVRENGKKEAG